MLSDAKVKANQQNVKNLDALPFTKVSISQIKMQQRLVFLLGFGMCYEKIKNFVDTTHYLLIFLSLKV
jgi:hypothetical protein